MTRPLHTDSVGFPPPFFFDLSSLSPSTFDGWHFFWVLPCVRRSPGARGSASHEVVRVARFVAVSFCNQPRCGGSNDFQNHNMAHNGGQCSRVWFKCFVSTVLLLDALAMLGAGTVCSFMPQVLLDFVTQYEPVSVSYVATAVLSVAGALMLCQTVLVASAFVLWVQATASVAMALTVAVLVFSDLQWLAVLFLGIGFHDYEGFPGWVLIAQIVGCAAFTLLNAVAVMWIFFFHRGNADDALHRTQRSGSSGQSPPQDDVQSLAVRVESKTSQSVEEEKSAGEAKNVRSRKSTKKQKPTRGGRSKPTNGMTELEDPLLDRESLSEGEDAVDLDVEGESSAEEPQRSGKLEDEVEVSYGFRRLFSLVKPHVCWLVSGCVALLVRLPFSLAQVSRFD